MVTKLFFICASFCDVGEYGDAGTCVHCRDFGTCVQNNWKCPSNFHGTENKLNETYENLYNDPFGLVNHLVNYIVVGVRQEEAPHLYLHHMINEQISTPSQIKLRVVLR